MRSRIPAGLVDAGFASLATFGASLYAAWVWQDELTTLGVYGLFIAAFGLAVAVGSQAVFIPAEKATLQLDRPTRVALLPATLRKGVPIAALAGFVMVAPAAIALLQGSLAATVMPLLVTAGIASLLAPIQDHTRRLFHLAGFSWTAATVSTAKAAIVAASLFILHNSSIATAWAPFGALAIGNVVSLTLALALARRRNRVVSPLTPDQVVTTSAELEYTSLFGAGRWLALTGVMSNANNLIVVAIISTVAGQEALGLAEAARTIGQPVLVLAFGLRSSLGPLSMEAARDRARTEARRVATVFYTLTMLLGAGYAALVGFDWVVNPFAHLTPKAYLVGGLVLATLVANALNGAAFPGRLELIGANQERALFTAEAKANGVQLAVAAVMSVIGAGSLTIGAYAKPVAFGGLGATRLIWYRRPLDAHYSATRVHGEPA